MMRVTPANKQRAAPKSVDKKTVDRAVKGILIMVIKVDAIAPRGLEKARA
jgi:hypothetical protein